MLNREGGSAPAVRHRFHLPDAQPLLQSLLAMLADLDLEYERERDRISSGAMNADLKARAIRRLEEIYRERREPYIRHLTVIQDRVMR